MSAKKTIVVEQYRSPNRRPEVQRQTLIGLGLDKLHRRRELEDTPAVRGMDFGVYMHLRRGMTEGEVLLRAGKPDQETVEGGRNFVVKSLYYYPTLSDPFITVITLRGGRVAELERKQKTF